MTKLDKRKFEEKLADEAKEAPGRQDLKTLYRIGQALTDGFKIGNGRGESCHESSEELENRWSRWSDNRNARLKRIKETETPRLLICIFREIWRNEMIREAWKTEIIVKLPKKGDFNAATGKASLYSPLPVRSSAGSSFQDWLKH